MNVKERTSALLHVDILTICLKLTIGISFLGLSCEWHILFWSFMTKNGTIMQQDNLVGKAIDFRAAYPLLTIRFDQLTGYS